MREERTRTIIPWFTVYNNDPFYLISPKRMREVLLRCGFRVTVIMDIEGQIIDLELGGTPVNYVRFEVELPDSWSLVPSYVYERQVKDSIDLLDGNGKLRGVIRLALRTNGTYEPYEAEFFCRYQLLHLESFYKLPLTLHRDCINRVVVDWAAVNPKEPNVCPIVVFHDVQPAWTSRITQQEVDAIAEYAEKERTRLEAGEPRLYPPVFAWLHENYPEYQDPAAYWQP